MIHQLFNEKKTVYSIEVFPPKREGDIDIIYTALDQFKTLAPDFISVTYGAGGSTSRSTAQIASYIQNHCGIEALAHLTCASLPNESSLENFVTTLQDGGVHNILALRGDQPRDISTKAFNDRQYLYASDLVKALHSHHEDFSVAGACYPEKHQEATNLIQDIDHLKTKVDAGVNFLVSQLFYDNDKFKYFLESIRSSHIDVPVSAGLMPITSLSQVDNIISLSGASLPKELTNLVERYKSSPEDLRKAGLDYTKKQMEDLVNHGVDGIHLYSMNKVDIASYIFG